MNKIVKMDNHVGNSLSFYPNPVTSQSSTVAFRLAESGKVSIIVTDIEGRKVSELSDNKVYLSGTHEESVDLSGLSNGV
ncbi:MAG: T9SS type A sorting domain-containing protein [Sphingobacteriales bacterium]|nr:MAG: T9SS type A sorting domain-containing protein [Sphingobacteriales bacterium]